MIDINTHKYIQRAWMESWSCVQQFMCFVFYRVWQTARAAESSGSPRAVEQAQSTQQSPLPNAEEMETLPGLLMPALPKAKLSPGSRLTPLVSRKGTMLCWESFTSWSKFAVGKALRDQGGELLSNGIEEETKLQGHRRERRQLLKPH